VHDFPSVREALGSRFGDAVQLTEDVGAVSAIGAGINATFANLSRCLGVLDSLCETMTKTRVLGVSTSSFRISVVLESAAVKPAVQALHRALVEEEPVP